MGHVGSFLLSITCHMYLDSSSLQFFFKSLWVKRGLPVELWVENWLHINVTILVVTFNLGRRDLTVGTNQNSITIQPRLLPSSKLNYLLLVLAKVLGEIKWIDNLFLPLLLIKRLLDNWDLLQSWVWAIMIDYKATLTSSIHIMSETIQSLQLSLAKVLSQVRWLSFICPWFD